ncbi:CinA family protein [Rhodococcus sp. NPDC003382]
MAAAPDPLVAATRAADLVAALVERGQTVATAESLTAGLLSATIAGVPGASAVLRGGLVVYATDLKSSLAGVDTERLGRDGPVAESTAAALAEGAAERCGATWGVGLTGVAGPDDQDGHPPGTLFLGICGPDGTTVTCPAVHGDRWSIRLGAVDAAVSGLLGRLTSDSAL